MALRLAARLTRTALPCGALPLSAARAPSLLAVRTLPLARTFCSAPTIEVPIPELGAESISEGGILSIAKQVGDYVAAEELVAEIETGAPFAQFAELLAPPPPRATGAPPASLTLSLRHRPPARPPARIVCFPADCCTQIR